MNEFQKVIDLLNTANDLAEGAYKRSTLLHATQLLLDEYIGANHAAGTNRKHSIEAVLDIFNHTGGSDE